MEEAKKVGERATLLVVNSPVAQCPTELEEAQADHTTIRHSISYEVRMPREIPHRLACNVLAQLAHQSVTDGLRGAISALMKDCFQLAEERKPSVQRVESEEEVQELVDAFERVAAAAAAAALRDRDKH